MPRIPAIQRPPDAMALYNYRRCHRVTATVLQNKVRQRLGFGRLRFRDRRSRLCALLEIVIKDLY